MKQYINSEVNHDCHLNCQCDINKSAPLDLKFLSKPSAIPAVPIIKTPIPACKGMQRAAGKNHADYENKCRGIDGGKHRKDGVNKNL